MARNNFHIDDLLHMFNNGNIPSMNDMRDQVPPIFVHSVHRMHTPADFDGDEPPPRRNKPIIEEIFDEIDGVSRNRSGVVDSIDLTQVYNEIKELRSEIFDVKMMLMNLISQVNCSSDNSSDSNDDNDVMFMQNNMQKMRINTLYNTDTPKIDDLSSLD